jgi:predicted N-acetyltransferase YhbS
VATVAARLVAHVAHVAFSPVRVGNGVAGGSEAPLGPELMALGPAAVRQDYQGQLIGTMLCTAGIEACGKAGARVLFVPGHTWFYPRLGFQAAVPQGFTYRDMTGPAFMLLPLAAGEPAVAPGPVSYHPAFDDA